MINKKTTLLTEWLPLVESLSNEDAGLLFKTILKYQNGDEVKNFNPVWLFIKSKIDEQNKATTSTSKSRSDAGKKGMHNRWQSITNDNKCYQMITNDNKCYTFKGEIIKLNQKDFDNWKNKFKHIQDLTFELEQLDLYLLRNPEKAKGWFFYVQQLLLKKNKELEPLPYNPRL